MHREEERLKGGLKARSMTGKSEFRGVLASLNGLTYDSRGWQIRKTEVGGRMITGHPRAARIIFLFKDLI